MQKKIPANSKEIAIARSYGDLRENHEYKAAKEMQKILMRQKDELEAQMMRARGMDFSNAKTDAVNIGTVVQATEPGNQPDRDVHDSRRVGFRSRQGHHQLSHAHRPGAAEPQGRRRSGI